LLQLLYSYQIEGIENIENVYIDDGAPRHTRQGSDAWDLVSIVGQAAVDLVGHHPGVEFLILGGNVLQVLERDDPAGWIG
jgi:hypothetical protein